MNNYYTPDSKDFARELRSKSTKSEVILWGCIKAKRLGVAFNRQKPIGQYIVDFYCKEARLVVEIDGERHSLPQVRDKDKIRDAYLSGLGIEVFRIVDCRVFGDLHNVLLQLKEKIEERKRAIPFPNNKYKSETVQKQTDSGLHEEKKQKERE